MSDPRVSVVMNCYNSDRYLRQAIDSVYAQTYADWEIVFFDNASTDSSAEIAKSYDERLRYFRNERTVPLGAARNEALGYCRGEFIAFLDCDDLWEPDKLAKQVPLFSDNEVGLVFSNSMLFSEGRMLRENFRSSKDFAVGHCFGRLLESYFLSIPTVVIRRKALDALGERFDSTFTVSEEVDLFLRIAHDWKLAMCPESLAAYRIHGASETWQKSERFLIEALAILDKFRALYPEFDAEFGNEARAMRDRAHWTHAIFCWRTAHARESRKAVLEMTKRNVKHVLFLVCTFLPYTLLLPLLNRVGRALPE
jgi:glycosyltransferase involved in cell wall biosynthesis